MKIAIGIPIVDTVAGEVYASHLVAGAAIARKHDLAVIPCLNVFPHDKARTDIINLALKSGVDMIFWIDSDMWIPADTFFILQEAMVDMDAQMAIGHAYRRGFPYTSTWFTRLDGKTYQASATPEATPCEIVSGGMACNLLDLNWVREHMEAPYFYQGYVQDKGYVWEDWFFCDGIAQAGGRIIGVPQVRCGHLSQRVLINDDNADYFRKIELNKNGGT